MSTMRLMTLQSDTHMDSWTTDTVTVTLTTFTFTSTLCSISRVHEEKLVIRTICLT